MHAQAHSRFRFAVAVRAFLGVFALVLFAGGCTSPREYLQNGFKVGPNYKKPPVPVAEKWIDADDQRVRGSSQINVEWWTVLNDPVLNNLIQRSSRENLTLREAGQRILEFRANRAIAAGNLFPQTQQAGGGFSNNVVSENLTNRPVPDRFFTFWDGGFNLAWELDFWGRFRRAIESADGTLNASIESYDDVLVALIGDVASSYVEVRTLQTRIKLAQDNVAIQRDNLKIAEALFKAGKTSRIDADQAQTNLSQLESTIPQFEITLRQAENRLCILMGMPPRDLREILGTASIPRASPDVAVGIPADLITRRPDVRRAERLLAAQSAQIGVATSELYPHIAVTGTIGVQANEFNNLFTTRAMTGSFGPSFQWNVLNYGRLLNNIKLQDARFQQLLASYQSTVLRANEEVENALVSYLKTHQVVQALAKSVVAAEDGVKLASVQYREGKIPFVVVATLQQNLVAQQDQLAKSYGVLVQSLIQTYKALGGGWQIRLNDTGDIVPVPAPQVVPDLKDLGNLQVRGTPDNQEFALTVNQPAGQPVTMLPPVNEAR